MGLPRRKQLSFAQQVVAYLGRLVPVARWLPRYNLTKVSPDTERECVCVRDTEREQAALTTHTHTRACVAASHSLLLQLQSDLIAGITVGLMVVPQALAYASIAGLPPEVGGWVGGWPRSCVVRPFKGHGRG